MAAGLCACAAPQPGPDDLAQELFRLARQRPLAEERISVLFDLEADDPRRASLFDALDGLTAGTEPQISDIQTMSDLPRTVVDLYTELPGGGVARYSVQLEAAEGGRWIVRWFHGPGVAWPPVRRPRDEGLSNSAPPSMTTR